MSFFESQFKGNYFSDKLQKTGIMYYFLAASLQLFL